MTTVQILAVSTPIMAFLFMGLIALIERRYDRAPAVAPGQPGSKMSSILKTAPNPAYADEPVSPSIDVRDSATAASTPPKPLNVE
jgi:hypothetical protein